MLGSFGLDEEMTAFAGFDDRLGVEFNGLLGGGSFEENEPSICKLEG